MNIKFPWIKYIILVILFAFWHQLYDFFPSTWAAIVSEGGNESIFAHMKMLFYPYLLVTIVEYFLRRAKGEQFGESFWIARMLILVTAPWLTMVLFYTLDVLGILGGEPWTLIFSILVSWIGIYLAIQMEEPLEAATYRTSLKVMIVILFISTITIFTGFSFTDPQYDFFMGEAH